ncbi:Na-translocating system protein MpsC family protein [Fusibacter sp. 3D3]|uniref:Na-translocating system protein MpsC family protein n=1 Tax=Fusibacter sp. 3D3 TaxID=1048380 RepID=UPI000853C367|nr:Na-translocating system protein MpsC family protein [Fusibacter sp. 3D3]GAU79147.1 hypothetical protein F3D3_3785 [Fusibacter sp. 3D3]
MNVKKEYERIILSKYVGHIKRVGGRGPKNIYVKIEDRHITINFALVFSPLEKFVYENLENASTLLTDLYNRVGHIIIPDFIDELSQEMQQPIEYVDYVIDVDNNSFQIILKSRSSIG